jgi:hypothetical protein
MQHTRRLLAASALASLAVPGLAQIELSPIGQYATGAFGLTSAEISAYDAASKRLFVTNATLNTVDVVDLADPTAPLKLFTIDASLYGAGVNSVAVSGGVVAVACEASPKTDPGTVVFLDVNGNLLSQVTVGALPDMLTFDATGTLVLVANEGEPNDDYTVDPEGSVSLIDLSGGALNVTQADVRTADFQAFNGVVLDPSIRIFGPGASVAQDLEPEYVTISDDGLVAWVTLQENNALARIDVASATVTELLPLGAKNHDGGFRLYDFASLPDLGTTAAGEEIAVGGFSGLFFEGFGPGGVMNFVTHGDRGPNAEPVDVDGDPALERPFALPGFQPALIRFTLQPRTGETKLTGTVPLFRPDGTPLTGLPNLAGAAGFAHADEEPVDLFGHPLPLDALGLDMEGVVRSPAGEYWTCEEYRPSIARFSAGGRLLARYVPVGSNAGGTLTGIERLPAVYAQRRANRGFEAIAWDAGLVYAFVQSPLDNPDVANDANSKKSVHVRVLAFDPVTEQTVAQYLYVIDGLGSDKIGDAVRVGPGRFWLIERDDATGLEAKKSLYEIDLAQATNLHALPDAVVGPGGTLELMTPAELVLAGIEPVSKTLVLDLDEAGFDRADKHEGLALVGDGVVAVLNDNDYQLEGTFDTATGLLTPNPDPTLPMVSILTIERITRTSIDPSDRDLGVRIQNWPVFGLYLPDAIDHFRVGADDYLVLANEGDARDYDGFAEEERVKDLDLDPSVFPNADALQADEQIGRLTVTATAGDEDGDGDYDKLFALGGRSITIRKVDGSPVWDSGDILERATAEAHPTFFNATNDDNDSFDTRSDNKGPEPEGLVHGEVDGRHYVFVGLERDSGVAVFDVTAPDAPTLVQYLTTRDFTGDPAAGTAGDLGPEGLIFVPAAQSPTNAALLIVSYEISGSVRVFQIDVL